jgi:TolA-binding protein
LTAKPYRAYGHLQIGIVKAILNQDQEAMANFEIVIKDYNKSPYYDDALFEKAQLDFERGNYEAGAKGFKELMNRQPNSKYIPYALQNKAIANYNLKNYNIVIDDYTTFLEKYATHKEANNVLLGLQEALALQDRSNEFDQYLNDFKQRNPDQEGLELVEFEAAKNLYFSQNYEDAINRFKIYIENYPEALNTTEAKYYIGESFYRLNQDSEALDYYDQVMQEPEFGFYPRVIQRIADIQFKQGNYENAIVFYEQLVEEATNARQQNNGWIGLMQSFYYMAEYDSVDYFARQILDQGNVANDAQNKSLLFFGKSAYARGDFDSALDLFLETLNSAKDEHGAEAQFLLAEILYHQNKYTESNEALYELHRSFSGFQVWYDRSFLQIADNFIGLGETFQAKQTLNSLMENSSLNSIVEQANQKLKSIEDTEASEIENEDQPEVDTVKQNKDNDN